MNRKLLLLFFIVSFSAQGQIPCSVTIVSYPITAPCCYDSLVAVVTDSSICGPWHFQWITGDTTQWLNAYQPGTYYVVMYNNGNNGCCGQDTTSYYVAPGINYHPLLGDTTEWNVELNVFPVLSSPQDFMIYNGDHRAYGDTLINGLHYKFFFPEWSQSAFIREDTTLQKVWFLENSSATELLIYDFSLNLNDSIYLSFPNYFPSDPFPTGWYYVDSVMTKNIFIGPRKHLYLSNPSSPPNIHDNNNRYYLEWIEGIGSNIHPAYIYNTQGNNWEGPFTFPCFSYFYFALSCEFKDGIKQYWDSCFYANYSMYAVDSCHYQFPGGIEEYYFNTIKLFPNPATSEIRIKSQESGIEAVEIYDVVGGKQMALPLNPLKGTSASIDVSSLAQGIYFVRVRTEDGIITKKLIKQ